MAVLYNSVLSAAADTNDPGPTEPQPGQSVRPQGAGRPQPRRRSGDSWRSAALHSPGGRRLSDRRRSVRASVVAFPTHVARFFFGGGRVVIASAESACEGHDLSPSISVHSLRGVERLNSAGRADVRQRSTGGADRAGDLELCTRPASRIRVGPAAGAVGMGHDDSVGLRDAGIGQDARAGSTSSVPSLCFSISITTSALAAACCDPGRAHAVGTTRRAGCRPACGSSPCR